MSAKTNCTKCKHYQVSWDPNAPHSCKLYKIKSKQMPKIIIKATTSGGDCMGFSPKQTGKKKGLDLNDPSLW